MAKVLNPKEKNYRVEVSSDSGWLPAITDGEKPKEFDGVTSAERWARRTAESGEFVGKTLRIVKVCVELEVDTELVPKVVVKRCQKD